MHEVSIPAAMIAGLVTPDGGAVTIDGLHPTGQGIEGKISVPNTGDGCVASLHFAAVLNVNN